MAVVSIRIYAPLSKRLGLAKGSGPVVLEQAISPGESVRGLFRRMTEQYPAFETVIRPETEMLVAHVILFVNGQRVATPGDYEAPLEDGAEVVLLPAYAGGRQKGR